MRDLSPADISYHMEIKRAFRTELDPTEAQEELFWRHIGAVRHVYNRGLEERTRAYDEEGISKTFNQQSAELTEYKREEAPWLYDISATTGVATLRNLDKAFTNYFTMVKKMKAGKIKRKKKKKPRKDGKPDGYPRFKARGHHGSFQTAYQGITVEEKRIKLSKFGWVKLKERGYLPLDKHINSVTISEDAGHWFISLQVDDTVAVPPMPDEHRVVALDIGVTNNITRSDGFVYPNPKILTRKLSKKRKLNKELSRRKEGGKNWEKTRKKIARLDYDVKNIRKNHLMHVVNDVCSKFTDIFIEDFNVNSVIDATTRNQERRAILDAAMGTLRDILKYKGPWRGRNLYFVGVGDNFPSNRMCSNCGHIIPGNVKAKMFKCPECYYKETRQVNTCHNLMTVAASLSETLNAWGDDVIPDVMTVKVFGRDVNVRLLLMTQEPSTPRKRRKGIPKGTSL